MDWVVGVDGERLVGDGAQADVDGLEQRVLVDGWVSMGRKKTDPLDYPCPHTRDMPLDNLIPRCAEHERAPVVYRREQRIAVFETVLEVGEGFVELFDKPVEFASLCSRGRFDQHP